jgi:tetratricopeptide (TPR) repeat protein
MHYKGSNKPLPEIANELKVDGIIEGSVLRAGDRVRISGQLVNAASDTDMWAKSYEGDLRDVLRLQGEIARAIADEVKANVSPDVKARFANARLVDPRAHEAYLKGRFFFDKTTDEGFQKGIEYAKQAVEIDPSYAQAYGLMALSYWMSSVNAYGHLTDAEAADKTKAAAAKALAIDDTLAEPHVALGFVMLYHDWDWAGAERELKRAIELNPNFGLAHYSAYAFWLGLMGRQAAAIDEAKRGLELDPFSPGACHALASIYYLGRQYDEALEQIRKCVEMFPDNFAVLVWLSRILHARGMYEQEIAADQKVLTLAGKPSDAAALGRAYTLGGITRAWRWHLEGLKKERAARDELAPLALAGSYAFLEDKDKALDWLERGYEEHDDRMYSIKADPRFDSLRSDPRFQMRVAIYARVSTDDKGQDPLNQLLELREFATQQGWTVVREDTDEATATNGERTGFKQMSADVAKHRFDLLLFWSLIRLTREGTYTTLTYLHRLSDAGMKFKSYTSSTSTHSGSSAR